MLLTWWYKIIRITKIIKLCENEAVYELLEYICMTNLRITFLQTSVQELVGKSLKCLSLLGVGVDGEFLTEAAWGRIYCYYSIHRSGMGMGLDHSSTAGL